MTKEDYLKSKYASERAKSPEKAENQLIDSYFSSSPKKEEEKSLKYSSYVEVSPDDIKVETLREPQETRKITLTQIGVDETNEGVLSFEGKVKRI